MHKVKGDMTMAKKSKVKKTLVDQILDKAKIDHDSLNFNGLEGELPEGVAREHSQLFFGDPFVESFELSYSQKF